jgi:hypothetical protein
MSKAFDTAPLVAALCVFATLLFSTRAADAHGVGLSRGDYTVSDREVTSRLVFARHEAALVAAGSASDAVVGLALAQRTRVSLGGKPCRPELEKVQRTDADGLELTLRYACPARGDAAFHFDFVGALGPGHRHVAEIHDGPSVTTFVAYKGNSDSVLGRLDRGGAPSVARPALGFLWLGIEHILTGWDHLLFLLGVALLPWRRVRSRDEAEKDPRGQLRVLLLSVSAFTVAHSITLTLGVLGIAPLAPAWVEPLIALSIAAVGLEALFMESASAPYVTTFAFGLIHGMGFAGALVELELGREQLPVALGLFNLGVELGQLAALAPVVLGLTLAARSPRVLSRLLPATGIVLTLIGVALFGVRVFESMHDAKAVRVTAAALAPR